MTTFPCPLIWIIHVAADLHQPLHCGFLYDLGGNKVEVEFFERTTNLHEVWDSSMIYHYLEPSDGDWYNLYQHLVAELKEYPERVQKYGSNSDPVAWANESIWYVRNDVYDWDPTNVSASSLPYLGTNYYEHNFPIACERMEAAGIRIANILNAAFASNSAPGHHHMQQHLVEAAKQVAAAKIKKVEKPT